MNKSDMTAVALFVHIQRKHKFYCFWTQKRQEDDERK